MAHLWKCKCYNATKGKDACRGPSGGKAVEEVRDQIIITLDFPGGCRVVENLEVGAPVRR